MNLIVALLALGLVGEAQAKKKNKKNDDKKGLRVKISTPVVQRQSLETESEGDGDDPDPIVTSGVTFFTSGARGEMTYMLGDGLELGGMLGFGGLRTDAGDGDDTSQRDFLLAATGSYNFRVDRDVRGFIQPIVGFSRSSQEIGDAESEAAGPLLGLGAGARFRYIKRATIDLSGEYNFQRLSLSVDGDDLDSEQRVGTLMIRLGLSGIL